MWWFPGAHKCGWGLAAEFNRPSLACVEGVETMRRSLITASEPAGRACLNSNRAVMKVLHASRARGVRPGADPWMNTFRVAAPLVRSSRRGLTGEI